MNVAIAIRNHRRAQGKAPSDPPGNDFNAAEALEAYHTEIVEIEALAHAAGEAVTHLRHTSDPELRRIFARIYTLTSKVAADLNASVRRGDKLIAALSRHMQSK